MSTTKRSTSKAYRIEVPKGLELTDAQLIELYRHLVLNRRLEDKLSALFRQGQVVGGFYSSLGQEATSVGTAYALEDGDFLAPMIRNLGSYLVRGVSGRDVIAQYMAREGGPTQGRDQNLHFGDLQRGLVAPISVVGALIPVMAGIALAMKHRGMNNVALTYIGDGGTSTTDFHEGLNFAAVRRLPFVLVAEHNLYAYSTPSSRQFPTKNIADKAPAYGITGEIFDGNNVLAAYDATRRARERALAGEGPVLLESKTFRRKGHAEHDPADYVPPKLRAEWEAKDPLAAYERFVTEQQIATAADVEQIDTEITSQINEWVDEVLASPMPDPEKIQQDVYTPANREGGPA